MPGLKEPDCEPTTTERHAILRAPQTDHPHRYLRPQIPTESHAIPTHGPADRLRAPHADESSVNYVGPNKVTINVTESPKTSTKLK